MLKFTPCDDKARAGCRLLDTGYRSLAASGWSLVLGNGKKTGALQLRVAGNRRQEASDQKWIIGIIENIKKKLSNTICQMKLFDSHCHLDDRSYNRDLAQTLQRARSAGVARMMSIGIDRRTSAIAVSLAQSHSAIYASVGVHPHDVKNCSESILQELVDLAHNKEVRAWGEIGLDFNRMYSPRQDQEKWFHRQLKIAGQLDLPMIFHERDSSGRFLEMLKTNCGKAINGVVHCFSGTREELRHYLDLGLHIGLTGIITMKSRGVQLREMVPGIPADRLLIETDAPYLTPSPERNRHRRNEPAFVKSVLLKLAEVRNVDPAKLAQTVWENTCRLYGLEA